ncbi:MAG TPA: AAA family ATPase [Jatrophihabitans sp.]|nr:AAA family ATPase [Jatrophihabitans sp.]
MPRRVTPLVGRTAELAELQQLLDGAPERAAVVSGDAGVGKTRLLAELIDRAEQAGVCCLVGHCLDFGDANLPYLPFGEAFGRLAAVEPDLVEQLRSRFGPIGRLLPADAGDQPRPAADADEDAGRLDRAALYDAVLGALEAAAERRPVLLLIEDLHWADQASRDLLGFLLARVRSPRLSLVLTYRSDDLHRRHPLRRALAEWTRLSGVRRVQLAPLTADEVRTLVAGLAPTELGEGELARIVERAAGNAFFAEELLSATQHAGSGDALPAELADLLLIRLDRLSDQARALVRLVAVAGGRLPHELLGEVSGWDPGKLEDTAREAVESHVLEAVGTAGYGFRHALLSEAVYDDLLPGERVRLHTAFARALADRPAGGSAAELAHHARRAHDLPAAFRASVQAGAEAMELAAPQEAMQHYEAALELLPSVPPPANRDWIRLILATAGAAGDAGHPFRSLAIVRDALERPPADLEPEERARLLFAFGYHALNVDSDADAFTATTAALRLVPAEPPSVLRARLDALHAHAAVVIGRDVDGARWAQEAIEMAVQLDRPEVASDARTTLGVIERRAGDPTAAADQFRSAADQAQAAGELGAELRSRYSLGALHYELGELPQALAAFRATADRAQQTGRRWASYGIEARALAGLVQFELGDWDASLATTDIVGQHAPMVAEALLTAVGLAVRAGRGEPSALYVLPRLRPQWERDGMLGVLTAGPTIDLLTAGGDSAAALAVLDDLIGVQTALWQSEWFLGRIRLSALGLAAVAAQALASPARDRPALAERAAGLAEAGRTSASRGLPAGRRLGVEALAWLSRLDAEAARVRWLTGQDPPELAEHVALWQASVDAFGYGHVYEQARSRVRLAEVLRAAGRAAEAAAEADLARTLARRLRAEPLLAELRRLGTAPADRPTESKTELTPRERDVLALLVDGRTNRQVAHQLYISEKTVSVHVSNLLAKLGVRSRAEAAALAHRDGLLDA